MSHDYDGLKFYKTVKHEQPGKNWILTNNLHNNLTSDMYGENYSLDSQGLKSISY